MHRKYHQEVTRRPNRVAQSESCALFPLSIRWFISLLVIPAAMVLVVLGVASPGVAEDEHVVSPHFPEASLERPVSIGKIWDIFWKQIEEGELERANEEFPRLIAARDSSGGTDLSDYASRLLDRGERLLVKGQTDDARVLYRWGYRLAPNSPEILWRVIPLASRFTIESPLYLLKRALSVTFFSPLRVLVVIQRSISPLLFALSGALFLSLVLIISVHLIDIFRVFAWHIPFQHRGWAIPLLFIVTFGLPLFAGLLWCLSLWAVALYLVIPERRFFSLLTGIVILAWGVLVPVSENLGTWLKDPHVHRVVLAGEQPLDSGEMSLLMNKMSEWSADSVVQLKFAQLLRRSGQGDLARKVLDKIESEQGAAGWIEAERGVLAFMAGDIAGSERLLRGALEKEGESAEILFNLSRVVFEQNNTRESRELTGRALRANRSRAETYRVREEILGNRDPRSFADVELPLSNYFSSAIAPSSVSFERAHRVIGRWMPGMEPRLVALVGLLLVLMHLLPHQRTRRINPRGLFDGYEPGPVSGFVVNIIPGGFLILGGKARLGFGLVCLLMLSGLPLINGAYSEGRILSTLNWVMPYHVCGLLLIYLVLMLCSINRKEG